MYINIKYTRPGVDIRSSPRNGLNSPSRLCKEVWDIWVLELIGTWLGLGLRVLGRGLKIVMMIMIMVILRYRMTPPESPRDRDGASVEMAGGQERENQNPGHVRDL